MPVSRKTSTTSPGPAAPRPWWTHLVLVAVVAASFAADAARANGPQDDTGSGTGEDGNAATSSALGAATATETNTDLIKDVKGRIAEVQDALQDLREAKSADDVRITALESRLQLLRRIQDGQNQSKRLRSQADEARAARAELQNRLVAARTRQQDEKIPDNASDAEIRERVRALAQSIEDSDAQSEFIASSIDFRLSRREELRELEAKNLQSLATIDAETSISMIDRKLQLERLQVEQELIEAEREMFKATDPNLSLLREVLSMEAIGLRERYETWRDEMNDRIVVEARDLAGQSLDTADASAHEIVKQEARQNHKLAVQLEQTNIDQSATLERLKAARLQLEEVRRQRLLDVARVGRDSSPEAVSQMRRRYANFPDVPDIAANIAAEQKLVQMARDDLDELETLNGLFNPVADAAETVANDDTLDDRSRPDCQKKLEELYQTRQQELVSPIRAILNERIDILAQLIALQKSVVTEIDRYKDQVLDRMVWTRDPSATTTANYRRAYGQFGELFSTDSWTEVVGVLIEQAGEHPAIAGAGILAPLAWISSLFLVRRRTRLASERLVSHATDSLRETTTIFGIAILSGLAWAAPALAAGILLHQDFNGTPLISSLHGPVVHLWQHLFIAGFFFSVLTRNGLAEKHFQLTNTSVHRARIAVAIGLVVIPFLFLSELCNPEELDLIPAGRILFTPIPILVAMMAWLLHHPVLGINDRQRHPENARGTGWKWTFLCGLIAILLLTAVATNLGWYRLVISLHGSLLQSLLLFWFVLLAREFLHRLFRVRNQTAFWQLREREEQGENIADQADELHTLRLRTRTSIRFGVVASMVLGLYLVWRAVFPAFAGLDQVVLWSDGSQILPLTDVLTTDSRVIITLGDALRAFVASVIVWYTARNLPALIELVIIDRFDVERGIKYAISQLLQWGILIGGLIYSASLISISWSSVQWLAAGLTVGLGFGLQEIFANFISGLIILFERPVRLGDVVTVGDTTGRVSRIRMRATTITDSDRKDLVVPNKKFVTESIVNWSIGDACIRLVIPVGASYDADPALVVDTLSQIAGKDPDVLSDPGPSVSFKSFGDSSLEFELRLYLPSTDRMSHIRTRINIEIKKAFDAAGISIPFPQREIRVEMVRADEPDSGPAIPLASGATEATDAAGRENADQSA